MRNNHPTSTWGKDTWPQLGPAKLSPLHGQWLKACPLHSFFPAVQLVPQGSKSLRWEGGREGAGLCPREQQGGRAMACKLRGMTKTSPPILAGIELALQVQKDMSPKATLKEFKDKLEDPKYRGELKALREEVEAFAATFPLPGLPVL